MIKYVLIFKFHHVKSGYGLTIKCTRLFDITTHGVCTKFECGRAGVVIATGNRLFKFTRQTGSASIEPG